MRCNVLWGLSLAIRCPKWVPQQARHGFAMIEGFNELEKKVRSLVVHPAMTWIRMDSSERYDTIRWCCGGAPL